MYLSLPHGNQPQFSRWCTCMNNILPWFGPSVGRSVCSFKDGNQCSTEGEIQGYTYWPTNCGQLTGSERTSWRSHHDHRICASRPSAGTSRWGVHNIVCIGKILLVLAVRQEDLWWVHYLSRWAWFVILHGVRHISYSGTIGENVVWHLLHLKFGDVCAERLRHRYDMSH